MVDCLAQLRQRLEQAGARALAGGKVWAARCARVWMGRGLAGPLIFAGGVLIAQCTPGLIDQGTSHASVIVVVVLADPSASLSW